MAIYSHSKAASTLAAGFYRTADLALKNCNLNTGGKYTSSVAMAVTSIANAAFACEVALKSHLPFNTQGHNLKALFEQLDDSEKRAFKNDIIRENPKSFNQPSQIDNMFDQLLEQCKDNFQLSRYIYEGATKRTDFPIWFMMTLTRHLLMAQGFGFDNSYQIISEPF